MFVIKTIRAPCNSIYVPCPC